MEYRSANDFVFVRLETGEKLMESLRVVAAESNIKAAAITSGLGMLTEVKIGFFRPQEDRYDEHTLAGEYEICSLQGNVMRHEGQPYPHVHGVFSDAESRAFGGHIMEATCQFTMEIFLRRLDDLPVHRAKVAGCPGTLIVPID